MKKRILIILLLSLNFSAYSQKENSKIINKKEIKEDLKEILTGIKDNYENPIFVMNQLLFNS